MNNFLWTSLLKNNPTMKFSKQKQTNKQKKKNKQLKTEK